MAQVILNNLDNPMRILGVKITTLALFPIAFICGAIFESFFGILGALLVLFFVKGYIEKLPKFAVIRFFYRHLPTDKIFGRAAVHLLPSHIKKWVK
ncbi:MAG: hypothetical protein K1060chlam2_00573 [Chlamydiae bacterium]|nr:hypothetical protein [Chlamydiota bacterium]